MQRMALILLIWLAGITAALAQNVTVIGPITPGDCPQFSSTTIIKDGGFPCNGAAGGPAGGVLSGTYPNPSFSNSAFANPAGAVGLTSVPGAAPTAMRSDAAPPLSPSVQSALTGTNNGVALGTGNFGFNATAPGTNNQALFGNTGTAPGFRQPAFTDLTGAATNAQISAGAANTIKGSLNGTATSDIILVSCSALYQFTQWVSGTGWQCGITPVLPSRAVAATLNLSAFSSVQTLGYANPGDGGGATFHKISSGNVLDSFVTGGSISQASSGCTNGSYLGIYFTGGTGDNFRANVTVSGGVVSAVAIVEQGGNGYSIGDILSPVGGNTSVGNCSGAAFTWTVSAVSSPLGSFTDSVSNKWQYTVDAGNFINPRQFGCKWNWNKTTGDAGATNDTACIKASYGFAAYVNPNARFDTFGNPSAGTSVVWPAGTALICDTITQYDGVVVHGQGPQNSVLKVCDAGLTSGPSAHVYQLCDPSTHAACFGTLLQNARIDENSTTPASSGAAIIFTNNAQQNRILDNVTIYSGLRGCLAYDTGYGGAANANFYDVFCTIATSAVSNAINITNTGTTEIIFRDLVVEAGGSGFTGNGFNGTTGQITVDGFHSEGVSNPININMATSTHSFTLMHASGGNGCTSLVTLQSTNTAGNFAVYDAVRNGCSTNLVADGQAGGTNRTSDAKPVNGWVSFNP